MIFVTDNSTWDFLARTPGFVLVLFLIRFSTIKFIWRPLGTSFNISPNKSKRPPPNSSFEKLYQNEGSKALKSGKGVIIAKQHGLSIDEVKNWFTMRGKYEDEPDLDRFCYDCWMATYYFFLNAYALLTLAKKNWFWDVEACWPDRTSHNLDLEAEYYLRVSFAFFILDTLVLLLKSYDRLDYYLVRLHHIVAGSLVALGYHCDMIRLGCQTLFLLELVTPFPYVSRIARKTEYTWVADLSFLCLVILWTAGRMFLGHFWLLPSYIQFRIRSGSYSLTALAVDFLIAVICITNAVWSLTISKKFSKVFLSGKYSNPWKALSLKLAERG